MSTTRHTFTVNSVERFIELLIADCLHDTGYHESSRREDHFLLVVSVILGGISARQYRPRVFFKDRFQLIIERMGGINNIKTAKKENTNVELKYKSMREFAIYEPNNNNAKVINDNCDNCPRCVTSMFQIFDQGASENLRMNTWNVGIEASIWTKGAIDDRINNEIIRSSSQVYVTLNKQELKSIEYVIESDMYPLINFGMKVSEISHKVVNNLMNDLSRKIDNLINDNNTYADKKKHFENEIKKKNNIKQTVKQTAQKNQIDAEIADLTKQKSQYTIRVAPFIKLNDDEITRLTSIITKWDKTEHQQRKAFTYYSWLPFLREPKAIDRRVEYRQKNTSQSSLKSMFNNVLNDISSNVLRGGILWSDPDTDDPTYFNLYRNLNLLYNESQFKFWGDFSMVCTAKVSNFTICTRDVMLQNIALFMGVSYCEDVNMIKALPHVEQLGKEVETKEIFTYGDRITLTEVEPMDPSMEDQIYAAAPAPQTNITMVEQPPMQNTLYVRTEQRPVPKPVFINTNGEIDQYYLNYLPPIFIIEEVGRDGFVRYYNEGPPVSLIFHN